MRRIVSLLPSTTEIVHALGCGDQLVGRSAACDHPPGVEELPVVTAPTGPLAEDHGAVHRQLRGLLADARSVHHVDAEALRAVAPDVVLTRIRCEVCAVTADEVADAVHDHLDGDVTVLEVDPEDLDGVLRDIRRIAALLEVPERGVALIGAMTRSIDAVRQQVGDVPRKRVVVLEWLDPLRAGGHWTPQLLAAAGAVELLGRTGHPAPEISWDELRAADPDAIVVVPCGSDLDRARVAAGRLRDLAGWPQLRAVREGQVFLADGDRYFDRPGPRLPTSARILAEMLHPDRFPPDLEGQAWERFV